MYTTKFLHKRVANAVPTLHTPLHECGDIETNPGPQEYTCPACRKRWRRGQWSLQCKICGGWYHWTIACAGVRRSAVAPTNWTCSHHTPQTNQTPITIQTHNQASLTPSSSTTQNSKPHNINILQININGIRNKQAELKEHILKHNIHIICIQETKLKHKHNHPKLPNFTALRQDRASNDGGGGLLTYIKNNIPFTNTTSQINLQANDPTQIQTFTIRHKKQDYHLANIYIPPPDSCLPNTFRTYSS